MEIKTRFNIGQDVFYILDKHLSIGRIGAFKYRRAGIVYFLDGNTKVFEENELFATRGEVLAELKELE